MKRLLCLLSAVLLMAACTSKAPENGALIQGRITGLDSDDQITALIYRQKSGSGVEVKNDTLKNGRFTFRLDSLADADFYLIDLYRCRHGNYEYFSDGPEVYLEPGAIVRIKGEGKHLRTARIDSPVKDQKLRQQFMKKMSQEDWNAVDDYKEHRYQVNQELRYGEGLTEEQKDSLRAVAQQDSDARNEVYERLLQQELKLLETEEIGGFALHRINYHAYRVSMGKNENRETVMRLYERLSDEQKATRDGMEILHYLNPVETVSIGSPVPSYDYIDKDGKSVHISDFLGKWVLMDFWSLGCGACIDSFPELGAISKDFQEELAVVSINLDTDSIWREALKIHDIFWDNWNDRDGFVGSVRTFGTTGLPVYVLVSPEGIIIDIIDGYIKGQLRSRVQEEMEPSSNNQ